VNKDLHAFLWFVLSKTDAYRDRDILALHRGECFLPGLRPDSFRRNSALHAGSHRQQNCKFLAAISISGIGLAQTSFNYLTKSPQDLVSLDMAVGVVEVFKIVEIQQEEG